MWNEIVGYVGTAALTVAIVAYLSKILAEHLLKKSFEKYRTDLQHEHERRIEALRQEHGRQVETLRHEFEKAALVHKITFEEDYSDRREALKSFHLMVRDCLQWCERTVRTDGGQHVKTATEKLDELSRQLNLREIYLTKETCQKWHELINAMHLEIVSLQHTGDPGSRNLESDRQVRIAAVKKHYAAWRALNEGLVADIRAMIGVQK